MRLTLEMKLVVLSWVIMKLQVIKIIKENGIVAESAIFIMNFIYFNVRVYFKDLKIMSNLI